MDGCIGVFEVVKFHTKRHRAGCLDYIREHTHTCYHGVAGGCGECPSCVLRERGLEEYLAEKMHTDACKG